MDHAEIRDKLSAYLDGAVTLREKSLIEKHLETCPECGTALRELRRTVARLGNLGEEHPPPWLTQRIMAQVGEEAGREKSLLRRLFLPLRWRLPMEAAALVFLSVSVYLVYRMVSPEVKIAVPPVAEIQGEAAPQAPPAAAPRYKTAQSPAETEKRPAEKKKEEVAAGRGSKPRHAPPAGQPAAAPSYESSRGEAPSSFARPPAPASPSMPENKGASQGILREDTDLALPRDAEAPRKEEKSAPSPAMRTKAVAPAAVKEVRLVLVVADTDTAFMEIDRLVDLSGGATVRRGVGDEGGVQTVRVKRERLGEFLERLGKIGEIRKKTPLPASGNGAVTVLISVETVNRLER
jgi:anti-sigma factor RsiW